MRIAICDDEKKFAQEMITHIKEKYQSLDFRIEAFESGEDLLAYHQEKKHYFDVILLDIEMIKLNGIETAKRIREYGSDVFIIFVTSHDELACTGYEVSAFRFITKPVDIPKLMEALNGVAEQLRKNKTILIENSIGEHNIKINDILYIEAQNQQVCIYTHDKEYLHRSSIGEYEKLLNFQNFHLIHRSYLVNLRYVKGFNKQEVILEIDLKIPLSRLRYKQFQEQFHNYINTTAF